MTQRQRIINRLDKANRTVRPVGKLKLRMLGEEAGTIKLGPETVHEVKRDGE